MKVAVVVPRLRWWSQLAVTMPACGSGESEDGRVYVSVNAAAGNATTGTSTFRSTGSLARSFWE